MAKRYQNTYRIPSARLPGHDYGAPGWSFVTICTKDRRWFFGDVVGGEMHHSAIGQRAIDNWQAIPEPLRIPLMCYDGIAILQGLNARGATCSRIAHVYAHATQA